MTITYPRALLAADVFGGGSDLRLVRGDAVNRTRAGALQVVELADPLWRAKYVTRPLRFAQRAAWKAWGVSLRGGARAFLGHHPIRHYPLAYGAAVLTLSRAGGGAFDGTATLDATTATTLSLAGLPAGYAVTAGDLVSIPMASSQRSLHVALEAATADGTGDVVVAVEPPVRAGAVTASPAVQLVRATCLMAIDWETFSAPEGAGLEAVSFEAVQVLA